MTAPTVTRPSLKQLSTIASLCVERGTTAQDLADELFGAGFDLNTLTGGRPGTASQMITALFGMPRVDGQGTTPQGFTVEPGTYRAPNGDIITVVISRAGQWYARTTDNEYLGKRVNMRDCVRLDDAEVSA